jgi:hypothetical protein
VQLALYGTTAVSVSLISIFPDRKNLHARPKSTLTTGHLTYDIYPDGTFPAAATSAAATGSVHKPVEFVEKRIEIDCKTSFPP